MNVCECEKTRIVEMLTIHMTRTDLNELTEHFIPPTGLEGNTITFWS